MLLLLLCLRREKLREMVVQVEPEGMTEDELMQEEEEEMKYKGTMHVVKADKLCISDSHEDLSVVTSLSNEV